jgi:hypothetical protein
MNSLAWEVTLKVHKKWDAFTALSATLGPFGYPSGNVLRLLFVSERQTRMIFASWMFSTYRPLTESIGKTRKILIQTPVATSGTKWEIVCRVTQFDLP